MRTKAQASLLVVAMIFALTGSGATSSYDPMPAPGTTIPMLGVDRNRIIEQMKIDISHLASTPRYSTEQYARAVAYVRAQAQAVGLDGIVEPVSGLSSWERGDSDRCELILPDGSTRPLRIATLAKSVEGEVEGEIVGVNYFFDKNQGPPPHRFDEGNQKRIVFFSRRLERRRFLDGYLKAVVQRSHGASWAAAYGAAAALVRSVQTGDGPPHAGGVTYAAGAPKIPAAALNVEDADRLEESPAGWQGFRSPEDRSSAQDP